MQKILAFKPIYKEKIWGGEKLSTFLGRTISGKHIGESWDISDYENDISVIKNGEFTGKSLNEVIKKYKNEILGKEFPEVNKFPILVKIIDAMDFLSVQVHPDDIQAAKLEGSSVSGKKEYWTVMQSDTGAYLYCGFNRKTSEEEYRTLVSFGRAEEVLQKFHVRKYDSFILNPGTIHAIGKGILLLEIQETADLTYRVYDYMRKNEKGEFRDLHLDKAMNVTNFNLTENASIASGKNIPWEDGERILLVVNDKFRVEKLEFDHTIILPSMTVSPAFQIITILEGRISITGEGDFVKGDSILVTAQAMTEGMQLVTEEETVIIMNTAGLNFQKLKS